MQERRELLMAAAAAGLPAWAAPSDGVEQALRVGTGGVLMFRHALAPGTYDPPGFKLGDRP